MDADGLLLHLGCGTSDLSAALVKALPEACVINGDFSEECLKVMSAKYPGQWLVMSVFFSCL